MICDLCGREFTPSGEHPGVLQQGGYPDEPPMATLDANGNPVTVTPPGRIETITLCDACWPGYRALPLEGQHALIARLRAAQTEP